MACGILLHASAGAQTRSRSHHHPEVLLSCAFLHTHHLLFLCSMSLSYLLFQPHSLLHADIANGCPRLAGSLILLLEFTPLGMFEPYNRTSLCVADTSHILNRTTACPNRYVLYGLK